MKNKENIQNPNSLEQYERMMTGLRNAELYKEPVKGNFDLTHLQKIHEYLFKDVYLFAGKIRTEDIAKDHFLFAPTQFIETQARKLFEELKSENYLASLPAEEFAKRAAYYMAEINVIHPFREGNGRTQREFIRALAYFNGYELDWTCADSQDLLKASILSTTNPTALSEQIYKCLTNKQPDINVEREYKNKIRKRKR